MFPIRNRTFESDDNADIAFSKLDWKVEKVRQLSNPLLNNSTTDTIRPWVGKIEKSTREFEIIQTAPFLSPRILEGNFFQIRINGQVIDDGKKSKIILKFKLGPLTSIFFILICSFPILGLIDYPQTINDVDLTGLMMSLIIPILLIILLINQLNRTENRLVDLWSVEETNVTQK